MAAVAFSEMVTRHPERYFSCIFVMYIFSKHMGRILSLLYRHVLFYLHEE